MPIPFSCPNCGKAMLVEDKFAGQSGPCSACGQSITIPGSAMNTSQPPPASSGVSWGVLLAILGGFGAVSICVIGILVALMLLPAILAVRTAMPRARSMNNMRQISLALHNYHDTYKSLPPAYVTDAAGKPLYSWRVLILPFMEQDQLYQRFDKTKAWDAPENIGISSMMVSTFRSPGDETLAPNGCSYFCFVGPNTLLPGKDAISFAKVTDGLSNTLFIIESKGISGSWAAPIDFDVKKSQLVIGNIPGQIQPNFPGGTNVGMADGSVRFLRSDEATTVLPLMIDRQDGQAVPFGF